jgi:hypothetical protein
MYNIPVSTSATGDCHPPPPESLLGILSDAPREYHEFHINYLSKLGDLDLARERYQNMTQERDNLLLLQESRQTLGIELQNNEKEFLANFPSREAALLREIGEIEEDIEQWKEKCLAEGIEIDEESNGSRCESQANSENSRLEDLEHDIKSMPSSSLEPVPCTSSAIG